MQHSMTLMHLLSDALGDGHGGDTARLRAADLAAAGVPRLCQVLRHLRRLPGPSLADHHQHLQRAMWQSGNCLQDMFPWHVQLRAQWTEDSS